MRGYMGGVAFKAIISLIVGSLFFQFCLIGGVKCAFRVRVFIQDRIETGRGDKGLPKGMSWVNWFI